MSTDTATPIAVDEEYPEHTEPVIVRSYYRTRQDGLVDELHVMNTWHTEGYYSEGEVYGFIHLWVRAKCSDLDSGWHITDLAPFGTWDSAEGTGPATRVVVHPQPRRLAEVLHYPVESYDEDVLIDHG